MKQRALVAFPACTRAETQRARATRGASRPGEQLGLCAEASSSGAEAAKTRDEGGNSPQIQATGSPPVLKGNEQ